MEVLSKLSWSRLVTSCCCLVVCVLLGAKGNPLVYPNRFSFQKNASTTTTTPRAAYEHPNLTVDGVSPGITHANGFRYFDILGWAGGVLIVGACVLLLAMYIKMKREAEQQVRYGLQSDCHDIE